MNQDKIKMREKLSFAMANFGNIPVMTLINGYLLIFYTNICGLSPADYIPSIAFSSAVSFEAYTEYPSSP